MKSFGDYILEEDVTWLKSASEHIFFADLHIPLTGKMLKRALNTKLPRVRVFHVTNPKYLDNMVKLQGKKKSLSAATRMHHEIVTGGLNVAGGMVFELEADVLISAPNDIMSRPDKTGRRWLEWFYLSTAGLKRGKFVKDEIEKYGLKLKQGLIAKYNPDAGRVPIQRVNHEWTRLDPRNERSPLYKTRPTTSKEFVSHNKKMRLLLRNMVTDYMNAMEKVVAKYPQELARLFFAHAQTGDKQTGDGWDELVVNNYKIKQVLLHDWTIKRGFSRKDEDIQEEYWEKLLKKLDDLGINYEVFENSGDISREITMRSNLDFL